MILLLLIASWVLANFSLVVGLCVAARRGDLQHDWATSLAVLGDHGPERRELDHAGPTWTPDHVGLATISSGTAATATRPLPLRTMPR
jgi:hypothetical protein